MTAKDVGTWLSIAACAVGIGVSWGKQDARMDALERSDAAQTAAITSLKETTVDQATIDGIAATLKTVRCALEVKLLGNRPLDCRRGD